MIKLVNYPWSWANGSTIPAQTSDELAHASFYHYNYTTHYISR